MLFLTEKSLNKACCIDSFGYYANPKKFLLLLLFNNIKGEFPSKLSKILFFVVFCY